MKLVHQTKDKEGNRTGKWEVAWTWLPHFIATNPDIVKFVAERMTEMFSNREVTKELEEEMHLAVIELILEKLPMPGLKDYLALVTLVHPEQEIPTDR
jgi:hypothetical protein